MSLSQGDHLGRFEILGPIGAGGMGEVWRARDTELEREVAIKVLPAEVADRPERRKRFEREARATAGLNHPNLLTIHDVGIEDGRPFIVTELLEGENLRRVLRKGLPSQATSVEWGLAIANGLGSAHAKAVVHRDIKPDNIFLTTGNRVKILDFGLAKILETELGGEDETAAVSTDTEAGTLLGTLGYMAPEQLRGDPVDPRTDVFSYGCVLFEMLTGRRPFAGGSSAEQISAVLRDDPPPLDEAISLSLRSIVYRCLEKNPSARYQSAGEVAAAVDTIDPSSLGRTTGEQSSTQISAAQSSAEPAVAVMPFANMSGDPEQEYFCDGMAEEILGAIGKVRGLKVLARSSSFAFKGQRTDPRKVGDTIGADHLLEGSIQRAGNRIRIAARLVQARDGTQLWADRYDRTISDIFELQDEISAEVANQLRTALLPDELGRLQRRHIPDQQAYDLFMQGRFLWNRRAEGDVMRAIGLFEQAIAKDPAYADPHVGIAEAFNVLGAWGMIPPAVAVERSRKELASALELGEPTAASHGALGFIALYFEYDQVEAEKRLRIAMDMDPGSGLLHTWVSNMHIFQGRKGEGAAEARFAVKLEPMSPIVRVFGGLNLACSGEFEEGLHHLREGVSMDPGNPLFNAVFGTCLGENLGRLQDALDPLMSSAKMGWPAAFGPLGCYQARLGMLAESEMTADQVATIAEKHHVPAYVSAFLSAGRRDVDSTLDAIERMVEETGVIVLYLSGWASFAFVHDHPRFRALMRRVGGGEA